MQDTLAHEHVSMQGTLTQDHVSTQDTLAREQMFSTLRTQFSRLFSHVISSKLTQTENSVKIFFV